MRKLIYSIFLLSASVGICVAGFTTNNKHAISLAAATTTYKITLNVSSLSFGANTVYTSNGNPITITYKDNGDSYQSKTIYNNTKLQKVKSVAFTGTPATGSSMIARVLASNRMLTSNDTSYISSPYTPVDLSSTGAEPASYFAITWDALCGTMKTVTISYVCS